MSWRKGFSQIASFLTQSGVPGNHSQDIAVRLGRSVEDAIAQAMANQSGTTQNNSRLITSENANTNSFSNQFAPPEQKPKDGKAGADGLSAWAQGKPGAEGPPGIDGVDGFPGGGGPTTIIGGIIDIAGLKSFLNGYLDCQWLSSRMRSCRVQTGSEPRCDWAGNSVCNVLRQQATELGRLRRRIAKLEEMLKDTVDC